MGGWLASSTENSAQFSYKGFLLMVDMLLKRAGALQIQTEVQHCSVNSLSQAYFEIMIFSVPLKVQTYILVLLD